MIKDKLLDILLSLLGKKIVKNCIIIVEFAVKNERTET